jgi:sugar lactone lactonase YvrE
MSKTPRVGVDRLERVGHDLHRPECVLTGPSGEIFVSDWRGGVTRIAADGSQDTCLPRDGSAGLRPNGIARAPDGSFLIANLGDAGGIWRLHWNGTLEPFLTEVDGAPVPPANFVCIDGPRTWISVSTRYERRYEAWRSDIADGYVVLVDAAGARIVADGLHYTNEVKPDPTGTSLYVVETFGRRLTRYRIAPDGGLFDREVVTTLGYGCFPDGFAFDDAGTVWLTTLISNRLLRVRDGTTETIMEDVNPAFVESVEKAFTNAEMRPEHLGPIPATTLQQLTSVAFGGADGRTVYLGSLHGTSVFRFRLDR